MPKRRGLSKKEEQLEKKIETPNLGGESGKQSVELKAAEQDIQVTKSYISRVRLWLTVTALCMAVFLVTLVYQASIKRPTNLPAITNPQTSSG